MMLPLQKARRFGFKTYYYEPGQDDEENQRIRFKRILKSPRPARKPVRKWLLMAVVVGYVMWHLHDIGTRNAVIQVESIKLEDVSPGSGN